MKINNVSFGVLCESIGYFSRIKLSAGMLPVFLLGTALDFYNGESLDRFSANSGPRLLTYIANYALAHSLKYGTGLSLETYHFTAVTIALLHECYQKAAEPTLTVIRPTIAA